MIFECKESKKKMNFILKQYDKDLLWFEYKEENLTRKCHILKIDNDNSFLLPIGLTLNDDRIFEWLKTRIIPKNRAYSYQLLLSIGLSNNDVIEIIKICKGLSLNDSYWVVEEDFKGKFKDYNLYENKFSNTLALIAYTGYGSNKIK